MSRHETHKEKKINLMDTNYKRFQKNYPKMAPKVKSQREFVQFFTGQDFVLGEIVIVISSFVS